MKLHRIRAVARKEVLHIIRDWRSLGIGIAIPMLLLLLFCYALTLDVDRVKLIVFDQSLTPASRDLISRFSASPYFTLTGTASSYTVIEQAMDRREALIALVIPVTFGQAGDRGDEPVQLIVDGSDATTATIALGYAETVARSSTGEITRHLPGRTGGNITRPSLELRPRIWYNEEMLSRNSIVPGLIAVIMMVIAALLTSLTVAREWETGTMEQIISSPLTASELVVGKLLPYMAVGILDLVLCVLVGRYLFMVPLRGSLWLLFLTAIIFLFGALSFGILISIITKNQLVASQVALVTTMLPAFLLSGFIFPIENMPAPIRVITHIITARYMVAILRSIYLKGGGIDLMLQEILFLFAFGAVVLSLAIALFRKRVD